MGGLIGGWAFTFRNRVIFRRDRGESLEKLHRPYRFRVWLLEFKGRRVGINIMTGLDPDYPQRGPYEAPEGTYPGRGR